MTAKDIKRLLYKRYKDKRQWVCFDEFRLGTGYAENSNQLISVIEWKRNHPKYVDEVPEEIDNPMQSIDFFSMNMYKTKKYLRIAHEIKVSKSDYLKEIQFPEKRQQAMKYCNQFYFVVPKGMVVVDDKFPKDCGLMYADENGIRIVRKAITWDSKEPNWGLVASICRRVTKREIEQNAF